MNCFRDEKIQAYLDNELSITDEKEFRKHLFACKRCRMKLEELKELDRLVEACADLPFQHDERELEMNTELAWDTFSKQVNSTVEHQNKREAHTRKWSWNEMKKSTKRMIIGGAAAVMIGLFSVPQVQVAASNFLSIFRVNQAEFVKMTTSDLQEVERWFANHETGEMDLKGLGKITVDETDKQIDYNFTSAEEMNKSGIQAPVVPKHYQFSSSHVSMPFTMTLELDVNKVNALLETMGVEQSFDQKLDQKPFSITVPQTMRASYQAASPEQALQDFSYTVIGNPEFAVPEDVSLEELRTTVLAMPFLPENVRKQLTRIEDWQHTLPVPIFEGETDETKEVRINGEAGYALETEYNSAIVWQKDGKVYYLDTYKPGMVSELTKLAEQL